MTKIPYTSIHKQTTIPKTLCVYLPKINIIFMVHVHIYIYKSQLWITDLSIKMVYLSVTSQIYQFCVKLTAQIHIFHQPFVRCLMPDYFSNQSSLLCSNIKAGRIWSPVCPWHATKWCLGPMPNDIHNYRVLSNNAGIHYVWKNLYKNLQDKLYVMYAYNSLSQPLRQINGTAMGQSWN